MSKTTSPRFRYTLHYVNEIKCGDSWHSTFIPRWECIDFKTLKEARDYLSIAGDNAYIIDNVTKQKIYSTCPNFIWSSQTYAQPLFPST